MQSLPHCSSGGGPWSVPALVKGTFLFYLEACSSWLSLATQDNCGFFLGRVSPCSHSLAISHPLSYLSNNCALQWSMRVRAFVCAHGFAFTTDRSWFSEPAHHHMGVCAFLVCVSVGELAEQVCYAALTSRRPVTLWAGPLRSPVVWGVLALGRLLPASPNLFRASAFGDMVYRAASRS